VPDLDRREALRRVFQPRMVPVTVQASREEPGAGDTPGAGAAGTSTPGESAEQEPDIDALAREVYQILRRRLQVERERDLGRL